MRTLGPIMAGKLIGRASRTSPGIPIHGLKLDSRLGVGITPDGLVPHRRQAGTHRPGHESASHMHNQTAIRGELPALRRRQGRRSRTFQKESE
jgi:hypothetical protein